MRSASSGCSTATKSAASSPEPALSRFEKDGQFVELWLEQPPDDGQHHWPELRQRTSASPEPVTLERRYEWSAPGDLARAMGEYLLFGCELPRLRVLALRNAMFSDEIVAEICRGQAAQLEELDFALGTLSDAGAAELVAAKYALPKLATLGVFECSLSQRGLALLRDAGFHVDDQAIAPAFAWRDPQQKSGRYASVNE